VSDGDELIFRPDGREQKLLAHQDGDEFSIIEHGVRVRFDVDGHRATGFTAAQGAQGAQGALIVNAKRVD